LQAALRVAAQTHAGSSEIVALRTEVEVSRTSNLYVYPFLLFFSYRYLV